MRYLLKCPYTVELIVPMLESRDIWRLLACGDGQVSKMVAAAARDVTILVDPLDDIAVWPVLLPVLRH